VITELSVDQGIQETAVPLIAEGSELGRPHDRQPAARRPPQARYLRIWDAPPSTGKSTAIMMGSFMIRRSFWGWSTATLTDHETRPGPAGRAGFWLRQSEPGEQGLWLGMAAGKQPR